MNFFDKVKSHIDYNNHYTIQKALRTLDIEFDKALKTNNSVYAKSIVAVSRKLYEDFSNSFKETEDYSETMSYSQKVMANKMRYFISYLIKKIETKLKLTIKRDKEIKQILENEGKANESNL